MQGQVARTTPWYQALPPDASPQLLVPHQQRGRWLEPENREQHSTRQAHESCLSPSSPGEHPLALRLLFLARLLLGQPPLLLLLLQCKATQYSEWCGFVDAQHWRSLAPQAVPPPPAGHGAVHSAEGLVRLHDGTVAQHAVYTLAQWCRVLLAPWREVHGSAAHRPAHTHLQPMPPCALRCSLSSNNPKMRNPVHSPAAATPLPGAPPPLGHCGASFKTTTRKKGKKTAHPQPLLLRQPLRLLLSLALSFKGLLHAAHSGRHLGPALGLALGSRGRLCGRVGQREKVSSSGWLCQLD